MTVFALPAFSAYRSARSERAPCTPDFFSLKLEGDTIIASYRQKWKLHFLPSEYSYPPFFSDEARGSILQRPGVSGAADDADGTAALKYLAKSRTDNTPHVDVIFFNAEDYGKGGDERMFCSDYSFRTQRSGNNRLNIFGVPLDMVRETDAEFPTEDNTEHDAQNVFSLFFSQVPALILKQCVNTRHSPIIDDHVLLRISCGIGIIDSIGTAHIGHAASTECREYRHA